MKMVLGPSIYMLSRPLTYFALYLEGTHEVEGLPAPGCHSGQPAQLKSRVLAFEGS